MCSAWRRLSLCPQASLVPLGLPSDVTSLFRLPLISLLRFSPWTPQCPCQLSPSCNTLDFCLFRFLFPHEDGDCLFLSLPRTQHPGYSRFSMNSHCASTSIRVFPLSEEAPPEAPLPSSHSRYPLDWPPVLRPPPCFPFKETLSHRSKTASGSPPSNRGHGTGPACLGSDCTN